MHAVIVVLSTQELDSSSFCLSLPYSLIQILIFSTNHPPDFEPSNPIPACFILLLFTLFTDAATLTAKHFI